MKSKQINFMFRNEKKEDLIGGSITITEGMNWLDLEKSMVDFLEKYTGKKDTVAAAILCSNWMLTKIFPDGMHFFLDWENDFGWVHAYLHRVRDPAPIEKVFVDTPPTIEEAPGGYITSACGTKFQRTEALLISCGAATGIVLKPDTTGVSVSVRREVIKMEDTELLTYYCKICKHSIPLSVVDCRNIKSGVRVEPKICPSCLHDQDKLINETADNENDFY